MTAAADRQPSAMVLEVQRMSTEDGPGIRTTVFFKGCSLRCAWCHNPESIAPGPQVHWVEVRCIGCHTCVATCSRKALSAGPTGIVIDRECCNGCGDCAEACPAGAMELLGRPWTVAELVDEVLKDRAYYATSGGGVTASGGEAALQAEAVAALFARCRAEGVPTALDTCGRVPRKALEILMPHTDLVLFDLKLMDPDRHRLHTGSDNRRILENLRWIGKRRGRPGGPGRLWIRTPIIPGATDDDESIRAVGRFIAVHLTGAVDRWELCAFNNLCRDKYRRLGLAWAFAEAELMGEKEMAALLRAARDSGVPPGIIHCSGAVRRQSPDPNAGALRRAALTVIEGGRPPAGGRSGGEP